MKHFISADDLKTFDTGFEGCRANRIAMRAVTENGMKESAKDRDLLNTLPHSYSLRLEQGAITNQKHSGRCWMFASLNVLRFALIKKLDLENFEFSQNYTLFYDKLEKANFFLESILETLDEPTDGRLIQHLLSGPLGDGGQWDMIVNLIEKYGLVPKYVMPESNASSATSDMNRTMTEKLRGYACVLRGAHAAGESMDQLRARKDEMLDTIYRILCICLGQPPKTFDFCWTDKKKEGHKDCGLTPKSFYEKYVSVNLRDYVSLINAPTADKPYHRCFTVKHLGNVKEGAIIRYLNLPIEELKRVAIAQMKDGDPVWFGCDVGKCSNRESGVMSLGVYRLDELLRTDFPMTKAERLDYGQSQMTHAMVFMGVDLNGDGSANRWRVENSWGDEPGDKGYYMMTDDWFDEYMYQVVVHKKYLTAEEIAEYESDPIELEPWDPMGSLAD